MSEVVEVLQVAFACGAPLVVAAIAWLLRCRAREIEAVHTHAGPARICDCMLAPVEVMGMPTLAVPTMVTFRFAVTLKLRMEVLAQK